MTSNPPRWPCGLPTLATEAAATGGAGTDGTGHVGWEETPVGAGQMSAGGGATPICVWYPNGRDSLAPLVSAGGAMPTAGVPVDVAIEMSAGTSTPLVAPVASSEVPSVEEG